MTLVPVEASKEALHVDAAFLSILAICTVIFLVLFVLIVVFCVRYRSGSNIERKPLPPILKREIEIGWTVATLFLALFIFWWFVGGFSFPQISLPGQMEIHIVAKQWMWKAEHENGAREINALHLPNGVPVRLIMTSIDVIHSFYVPDFRVKQDVVPGRYTELVFTPDRIGTFRLLCAEYCGTQHSRMSGEVVVMSAQDFAQWEQRQPHGDSLVDQGRALYTSLGCGSCHDANSGVGAPPLDNVFGTPVRLADGRTVEADEQYLRNSLVRPNADMVAGYRPIMPSYADSASESGLTSLVAYLKSLPTEGKGR